jgi:predicted DNA binding protein
MRRLTFQISLDDALEHGGPSLPSSAIKELESFEILDILKQEKSGMALIARLSTKNKNAKMDDLFGDELIEYQLLEKRKDGSGIYFFKTARRGENSNQFNSFFRFGGYQGKPFFIGDGKATMTFLGSSAAIKNMMKTMESFKIPFKVLSLSDAKFSYDSPLSDLTEKQRRVIISAFNSGYYDVPRRTSSEQLADKLEIRPQTFVMHRRKAEHRVLEKIING